MDEKIIRDKIEKSLEIICPLYKDNLIIDAYIIGSVATGKVDKDSDIDIVIINPDFIMAAGYLSPISMHEYLLVETLSENELKREYLREQIVKKLKDMGVEFKVIHRKGEYLWNQLYKGEMFHILPFNESFHIENLPHIRLILQDLCG